MLPGWNLKDLYENEKDPQITKDLQSLSKKSQKLEQDFNGKIKTLTGDELAKTISAYEKISEGIGKLATYTYLYFVTEMTNPKKAAFYQNISESINDISTHLLFLPLEIAALSDAQLKKLSKDSKKLQKYSPFIRDLRISKKYQKSKEIERVLHEKDQTANSAWSRLFDETMASLTFAYDKKNLTAAEIFNLFSSDDSNIRKKAAKSIGEVLGKNIKLFSFITNTLAKDKAIDDKIRNYPHPVKARNVSNLVEDEVVECLVGTVKKNYKDFSHRYYKIKAKIYGKKTLDYWDRNAPLPKTKESKIPYSDAKKIVLDAYADFSPKMAEIAELFFKNNWIDVPPRKGKDSGAFSHPCVPSSHPYIMLNYQGKLRDVMTLAHELGHGVHQYLASKQGYFMSDTPLTLAETASIFGEQLTFESLLKKCKNNEEKRNLLVSKIEDSLNTIVRQVAFFSFEYEVHTRRKEGEISADELNKIWLDIQKESLGPAIKFHDEYKYYWSYIPHFIHSPFYVYAYAFGNLLVNGLYSNYKKGLPDFEKKYLTALSSGGVFPHKELLQPFGLNAADPNFWQEGLAIPINYINELEQLI